MAKTKENQIVEVRPTTGNAIALPSYLQDQPIVGLEQLAGFVTPPRLKVVQKTSNPDLLAQFGEGDIILLPDMALFAEMIHEQRQPKQEWAGTAFRFTPVFFFAEWCVWNPIGMKGTLPAIRARTLDPKNPISIKARNRDMWFETCPENDKLKIRYSEHLNFLIALHDGPYAGTGIALTFSRGAHFAGTRLCNLIKMRKTSLYNCVFEGRSTWNKNEQGDWFQIEAQNPALDTGSPWVSEAQQPVFQAMHEELKSIHDKLVFDYGDADDAETPTVDVNSANVEY